MLRRALLASFLVSTLAAPVAAKGVLYDCDLNANRAMGWVSNKMAFVFDGKGDVQIVDSVVLHYVGNPVPARVRRTGDVARLNWTLSGAVDRVGQIIPTISYSAKLDLKKLTVEVLAKPARFPQRFTGKGRCTQRKNR